jgi:serine phosphatase RsbU (regulator of sigma subunit)
MESTDKITQRIEEALAVEEIRAELFANRVRLILISIMMVVALLNIGSITLEANIMNIGTIMIGYLYGFGVFMRVRRGGSVSRMKYITSFVDIFLVMVLLFMYTKIEVPAVALKNYVFLVVFPLILLTAFRFDQRLTLSTGIWAVFLYLAMFGYLYFTNAITMQHQGYISELFSPNITFIGQATKVVILICFVALATYLAKYSRSVILKTIQQEVTQRTEKDAMVRELEIASNVQQQLLPRTTPSISGLECHGKIIQGKFVGGDYFDFLKVAESRLISIVADVSGKGVPAALIMAEVRAATHLLATMNLPIDEFIRRLNRLVLESTARQDYVTYFIAEIDSEHQEIKYVNAGHPPSYVYHSNSQQPLSTRTLALGLREDLPQLEVGSVPFPAGSIFVAYTDGILERAALNEEQYGENRLTEYIRSNNAIDVTAFAEGMLRDVKRFGGDKPFDDDATIVVVRSVPSSRVPLQRNVAIS